MLHTRINLLDKFSIADFKFKFFSFEGQSILYYMVVIKFRQAIIFKYGIIIYFCLSTDIDNIILSLHD